MKDGISSEQRQRQRSQWKFHTSQLGRRVPEKPTNRNGNEQNASRSVLMDSPACLIELVAPGSRDLDDGHSASALDLAVLRLIA